MRVGQIGLYVLVSPLMGHVLVCVEYKFTV
jgi:hypothetical protein